MKLKTQIIAKFSEIANIYHISALYLLSETKIRKDVELVHITRILIYFVEEIKFEIREFLKFHFSIIFMEILISVFY